jgi:hypothetical protein
MRWLMKHLAILNEVQQLAAYYCDFMEMFRGVYPERSRRAQLDNAPPA